MHHVGAGFGAWSDMKLCRHGNFADISRPMGRDVKTKKITIAAYNYNTVSGCGGECNRRQIMVGTALTTGLFSSIFVQGVIPQQSVAWPQGLRQMSPEEKRDVKEELNMSVPPSKAPLMLRLVFHDAATFRSTSLDGGLNASIQFELERPENFGLKRGVNVIKLMKNRLKGTHAEGLSEADLIALSGAHAVKITKGPDIDVLVGRVDADKADPMGRLPEETFSAGEQIQVFEAMGFKPEEMVALLGSHTVSKLHSIGTVPMKKVLIKTSLCFRLQIGGKGFGDPLTFDNTYYDSLLKKPWENKEDKMASMIGLKSDRILPDDPTCRPIIEAYAKSNELFLEQFSSAYTKMTFLGCA
jgi:L-ascorbate peroxidase